MQAGTRDAVTSMERGRIQVEEGAVLADQSGAALDQILQLSEAAEVQVSAIAATVQQTAAGAQSVADAMLAVSAVVDQNGTATEEVSASVEEMTGQVEEMDAQTQELAAMAVQLHGLVAHFMVEAAAAGAVNQAGGPVLRAA